MALIEDSVGELPYKLLDMDQHSVEAEDCFTRFMPADKIDTAVRADPVGLGQEGPPGQRPDRDGAGARPRPDRRCPGRWRRCSGSERPGARPKAERFYQEIQREYRDKEARLVQLDEQQIERAMMYPGGWGRSPGAYLRVSRPSTTTWVSFNRWIDEDWGFNHEGPDLRAGAAVAGTTWTVPSPSSTGFWPPGARFIMLPSGPGRRTLAGRSVLRPVLVAGERGEGDRRSTTSPSTTTRRTSPRTGAGVSCRRSRCRPGSGRTPTASGPSPTPCPR